MMADTTLQGFTLAQRLFAILMAVLIVGGTVELIRRRKLREEYAMLWVCASAAVVVFAIFPNLLFWLLNRFIPFRVDPDGERIGMDLHELGGGAYPEFVIHRDESYR